MASTDNVAIICADASEQAEHALDCKFIITVNIYLSNQCVICNRLVR